jgi:hypothetical protein
MEEALILDKKGLKIIHISGFHAGNNLIVWKELLLKVCVREDLTIWNVPH